MADTIFLNPGELSARTLSSAKSSIDHAVAKTKSANDSAAGARYFFDGTSHSLFTGETGSLIARAYLSLTAAQEQLDALSRILDSGPDSLEAIDRARKSDLTSWVDRAAYDVKTTVEQLVYGFFGLITVLFTSGEASTGGETNVPAVNNKPATGTTEDSKDGLSTGTNGDTTNEQTQQDEFSERIKQVIDDAKKNELGNRGEKYWSWYYKEESTRSDQWCAVFVSYLLSQAGVDVDAPTKDSKWFKTSPSYQADYFKSVACFENSETDYKPKTGDLVFFDNVEGGNPYDHVGIIYVDNGELYALHGNWSTPKRVCYTNLRTGAANREGTKRMIDCVSGYGNVAKLYSIQQNT